MKKFIVLKVEEIMKTSGHFPERIALRPKKFIKIEKTIDR